MLRGIIDFFEKNGGTVVPVELVSFDAKARGNNVDVFWATASEQNADHFVVERAAVNAAVAGNEITSAETYVPVATVVAAGNTTERRDYGVKDLGLADGTSLYRLVMVDRDGSTSRTSDVEVVIGQGVQVGQVLDDQDTRPKQHQVCGGRAIDRRNIDSH